MEVPVRSLEFLDLALEAGVRRADSYERSLPLWFIVPRPRRNVWSEALQKVLLAAAYDQMFLSGNLKVA